MPNTTNSANESLVEGHVAVLLRALRSHTYQSLQELEAGIGRHVGDDTVFPKLLKFIKTERLVTTTKLGIQLTEDGEVWLDEHGYELEIEDENLGFDGKPNKPYAVAKLKMETKHLSVFQALRKIEREEININPEFQRAFVWDVTKQSRLIESILIRIPLPAFYLDATDQIHWSVVDGLQRLTTLYRYCRGKSFPLIGLQFLRELEGETFDKLPSKYQVLIEDDTQLLFYNLMPGTPIEAKFTIFSRVNTGGMQLTPQEIRHALNQGPITNLLAQLSKDAVFKRVTQGVVESLRMSDRELILRALAFMHMGINSYKEYNEMDGFLLASMSELNKLPSGQLAKLEKDFIESISKVRELFGKYAFRKFTELGGRRSPFNKALFEAWAVAVRNYSLDILFKHKKEICNSFAELIRYSPNFVRSISSNTASYTSVHTRFTMIEKIIIESVS